MNGLVYIGDILIDNKNKGFRIRSSKNARKRGALWHSLKQRLDLGFRTTFAFKFRNALIHHHSNLIGSIMHESVMGSPNKASTRNYMSQQTNHFQQTNDYGQAPSRFGFNQSIVSGELDPTL